ncbi:hypothetical protein JCM6882_007090 [Rhodosporidiobolus microsporus]
MSSPSASPTPSPSAAAGGGWIPLGAKRAGMTSVASFALLSLICVVSLATYSAVLLRRHSKRTAQDKVAMEMAGRGRAIKFLRSGHGILLGSLLLGDLFQSTGFVLNFGWIARGALPTAKHHSAMCTVQGVAIQAGDLGSAFSSLVICVNLFLILVFQIQTSKRVLLGVLAAQWSVIALMTFIGPVALTRDGVPFYGPSGGWCWMGQPYQSERLTLHYLWVFIVAFVGFILYAIMAIKIWLQRRAFGNEKLSGTAGVAKVMMLYPLVYVATILPLSCFRIASMAGKQWPTHYLLAAGTIFTCSGTANCIIYATTRSIVTFDTVGSALRRGSGALSGAGRGFDSHRLSGLLPRISFLSTHGGSDNANPAHTLSTGAFALSGIRVDVETDVHSPEVACYSPQLASSGGGGGGGGYGARTGKAYQVSLGGRRVSEAGVPVGERPFSALRKMEEEDEAERGDLSEGKGEEEEAEVSAGESSTGSGSLEEGVPGRRGTSRTRGGDPRDFV